MLSRQHNFYQQILQLVDAALICASLWLGHAARFFLLSHVTWFGDNPIEPQFANCYWMIALALPLGPLSLRWSYLPAILPYLVRFVRALGYELVIVRLPEPASG